MVGCGSELCFGLMVLVEKCGRLGVWCGGGQEAVKSMNGCHDGL